MSTLRRICLLGSLLALGACTVQDTPIPALTGPSELGLRVALQVSPDSILQDGASQSSIQIDATGADGRPIRGMALRVETEFEGVVQDYGTLSAKTVVTADDGRARVTYTSPPRPSSGSNEENVVLFRVTPIGNDYTGEVGRTATLRLVTPGVILPPNSPPTATFTYAPQPVGVMTNVIFDASTSTDAGQACGAACTYSWDFGDGGTATGIFAPHQFRTAGAFVVRLTVADARGAAHSTTQTITVGGTPPTAEFSFSPSAPSAGQLIFFNAQASRPATGRQLVSYEWDFGSGRTGSGITTSKQYDTPGTYAVTLTVTDDAGQSDTDVRTVTVGANSPLTVSLSASPASAATNQVVLFTATATGSPTSPILDYRFKFDDGTGDVVGTASTTTHRFAAAGVYGVTVTVRDSANRTATGLATVTITASGVGPGNPPTPIFTFSPTSPNVNQTVFFNGTGSTTAPGTTITSYAWDFGNGVTASGPTPTHAFNAAGTFVVRLTVTNSAGQSGTTTQNVPVVPVTGGGLTARLTVAPNPGNTATNFVFDASTSTPGSGSQPIVEYRFRFGDGLEEVSPSATTTHRYAANGTYSATVTIRDSANNTVTSTAVTVTVNSALQARITATPTTGSTATSFFFDARTSTPGPGTFLTTYRFTFGDGTFEDSTSPTATHIFTAPGAYTVTVTVRDNTSPVPLTSTAAITVVVTP